MPSAVNAAFDGLFCINLDRRPDRWEEVSREFARVSIQAERFPAVDGMTLAHSFRARLFGIPPGNLGLTRTVSGLIRRARAQGMRSILVFEDDVVFAPGFEERFEAAFRNLPGDWARRGRGPGPKTGQDLGLRGSCPPPNPGPYRG